MSKGKPIGWITAATLLCVAGVSIACRLNDGAGATAQAGSPSEKAPPAPPPPPFTDPAVPPSAPAEEPQEPVPPSIGATVDNELVGAPSPTLKKKSPPKPVPVGAVPPPLPTPPAVPEPLRKEEPPIPVPPEAVPVPAPAPPTPEVAPVPGSPEVPPAPPEAAPVPAPPPPVEPLPAVPVPPKESPVPAPPPPTVEPSVPVPPPVSEPKQPEVQPLEPPAPVEPPRRPRVREEVIRPTPKVEEKIIKEEKDPKPSEEVKITEPWKPVGEPVSAPKNGVKPRRPQIEAYIPTPKVPKAEPALIQKQLPIYQVEGKGTTLKEIAEDTLGTSERWQEIKRLNPKLKLQLVVPYGTKLRLPVDAKVKEKLPVSTGSQDESEPVTGLRRPVVVEGRIPVSHLPIIRSNPVIERRRERAPLTGTYRCKLRPDGSLYLPEGMKAQLKNVDSLLITPGPDQCLWLSTKDCTKCILKRVEKAYVNDDVVRAFRRLYFAQSEKTTVEATGQIGISKKLAQYAGLGTDLIVIGSDDHFELWDAERWHQYSLKKTSTVKPYGKKRSVIRE